MSGNIPLKQQKLVCIKSGNRCAMTDCRRELVVEATENDDPSIVAVFAHIKGENEGSARFDASLDVKERNKHANLIFICANCHKKIDDQPQTYTTDKLYQIKATHEEWVRKSTEGEVVNVTFAELNVVTKYLVSGQYQQSDSLLVVHPADKIKKNGLSGEIEALIRMGTIQANQVADYIDKAIDIDFGERLKQGFVNEYERLKNEEQLEGDDLFMSLLDFASGGSNDFKEKAAGLAVLVYLFEKCEVFEK